MSIQTTTTSFSSTQPTTLILAASIFHSMNGFFMSIFTMIVCWFYPSLVPASPRCLRLARPPTRCMRSSESIHSTPSTETLVNDDVVELDEESTGRSARRRSLTITSMARRAGKEVRPLATKMSMTFREDIRRPVVHRMSSSFQAVASPFTTSTSSPFSPASDSYFPRAAHSQLKEAIETTKQSPAVKMMKSAKSTTPRKMKKVLRGCSQIFVAS